MVNWGRVIIVLAALFEVISFISTGSLFLFEYTLQIYEFMISISYIPPILTFLIGLGVGAYLGMKIGSVERSNPKKYPGRIFGCLLIDNVLWKARADISELAVSRVYVESEPYCPDCNTVLDKDTVYQTSVRRTSVWECANCEFQTEWESDTKDKAERIIERHFRKIATNRNEDYAYSNLINNIKEEGKEITSESIWEEYVKVVDDEDYLSTECFL